MSERRLKVLQITPMYPSEKRPAFGTFVKSQVDSLRPYVDIDLLILPGLGGIWPYIKSIGVIRRKLKNHYDIIHVHFGNVSSMIKFLYWGKTPLVTSYCGDDLLGRVQANGRNTLKSVVFMHVNAALARFDSYAIVKSKELGDKIKGKTKHIEVIPNGVQTDKFHPISKIEARKKIGVPVNGKRVLTFPANPDVPRKNFVFLKKVLDKIAPEESYTMLFFKDGHVSHDLVPYYLNAADAVVLPSLKEGSPNVIKESMACNANVISSNAGDVEWLLDGVRGSAVLPLEEKSWEIALQRIFNGELDKVESNAREQLLNKELDIDSVARRIVRIYNQLVKKVNAE